jgi:hypothetical protein
MGRGTRGTATLQQSQGPETLEYAGAVVINVLNKPDPNRDAHNNPVIQATPVDRINDLHQPTSI